jgi:hypothetical protein
MSFRTFEDTYRMYRVRDFDLITVSANMPDEKTSRNCIAEMFTAIVPIGRPAATQA